MVIILKSCGLHIVTGSGGQSKFNKIFGSICPKRTELMQLVSVQWKPLSTGTMGITITEPLESDQRYTDMSGYQFTVVNPNP